MNQSMNQSINNHIENLKYLRNIIISGKIPEELLQIRNRIHRDSKTNYVFHRDQVKEKIDWFKNNNGEKFNLVTILSRVSYMKPNTVDIDLCLTKNLFDNNLYFYFIGRDLAECFILLPSYNVILPNGKSFIIYSKKGHNHCRIYPFIISDKLIEIAINLRLLEIYTKENNLHTGILKKQTHLLGSVIPFEIPDKFKLLDNIIDPIEYNSIDNPVKIHSGIFLFGINGLKNKIITKMLTILFVQFPCYQLLVFKFPLSTYKLSKVLLEEYKFILTSWDKHQRLLIKIPKDKDYMINTLEIDKLKEYEILIIDPWKRKLSNNILIKLNQNNPHVTFRFMNRNIKDQDKEGSCSMCILARLLYILDSLYPNNLDPEIQAGNKLIDEYINILNKPIPDFYAYLVKYLYRKSN